MTSRVNIGFVVGLSAILILFALGVGFMVSRGAFGFGGVEAYLEQGDRFAQEGEWLRAVQAYGKAVDREQYNDLALEKFTDALERVAPARDSDYAKRYGEYVGALRLRAIANPSSVDHQVRFLEEERLGSRRSLGRIERFAQQADERIETMTPGVEGIGRVKRYRGLANLDRMRVVSLDDGTPEQTLEDLEAAVEADPSDSESRLGIVRWHRIQSERAEQDARAEEADTLSETARRKLDEFIEAYPNDVRGRLLDFNIRDPRATGVEGLRELAGKAVDALVASPPETIDELVLSELGGLFRFMDDTARERLVEAYGAVAEADPESSWKALVYGEMLQRTDRREDAREVYTGIIERDRPPLSYEGIELPRRQLLARVKLVNVLMRQYESFPDRDSEAAQAIREEIEAARDDLAANMLSEFQWQLRLADAKIALIDRRGDDAVRLLSEVRRSDGRDTLEVRLLQADALRLQNKFGEARLIYRELLGDGGNPPPMVFSRLADTLVRMGGQDRLEEAQRVVANGLLLYPNDASLLRLSGTVETLVNVGRGDFEQIDDPLIAMIVEVERLVRDNKMDEAIAMIEGAHGTAPNDGRLLRKLIEMDVAKGERDRALARIDERLAITPDSQQLRQLRVALEIEDPVLARVTLVQESDRLSEAQKLISTWQLYSRAGRSEEGAPYLDEAIEKFPDDKDVLEARFTRALRRAAGAEVGSSEQTSDLAEARQIARTAASVDADGFGGRLFTARISLVTRQYDEAIESLNQAIEILPEHTLSRRLLGTAYLENGNITDAVAQLERAYAGDPSDSETVFHYARALINAGQAQEALDLISPDGGALGRAGIRDTRIVNLWLELEAALGDVDLVIGRRLALFEQGKSGNIDRDVYLTNLRSLLPLLDRQGRTDESQRLLDEVADLDLVDDFPLVTLRAQAALRREDVPAAVRAIRAYIESVKTDESAELSFQAFVLLSEVHRAAGNDEASLAALKEGLPYQDEDRLQLERLIGDRHYTQAAEAIVASAQAEQAGQTEIAEQQRSLAQESFGRAAEAYRSIVERGADTVGGRPVAKRLAETLLQIEAFDEARAQLQSLSRELPDDIQIALLQAELARAEDDLDAALVHVNRAITIDDSRADVFVRRARLLTSIGGRDTDVITDLEEAVKRSPDSTAAWALLVQTFDRQGKPEEVIARLRQAVDANPNNASMIRALILALRSLPDRRSEAIAVATQASEQFPGDPAWLKIVGDLHFEDGNPAKAAEWYRTLYEIRPDDTAAADLLNAALLAGDRFERREIRQFLEQIESIENPNFLTLMLRARARIELGETDIAQEHVAESYRMVKDSPQAQNLWFNQLGLYVDNDPVVLLSVLDNQESYEERPPLMQVLTLRTRYQNAPASSHPELLSLLEAVASTIGGDRVSQITYHRLAYALLYAAERYEEAVESARIVLDYLPNDLEINNNLAYTLAKFLDDPAAAEPLARTAAEQAPSNSSILDTLGYVLLRLENYPEAVEALSRSVTTAQTPRQRGIANAHLGQAYIGIGDRDQAERALRAARAEVDSIQSDSFRAEVQTEIDRLAALLDG